MADQLRLTLRLDSTDSLHLPYPVWRRVTSVLAPLLERQRITLPDEDGGDDIEWLIKAVDTQSNSLTLVLES